MNIIKSWKESLCEYLHFLLIETCEELQTSNTAFRKDNEKYLKWIKCLYKDNVEEAKKKKIIVTQLEEAQANLESTRLELQQLKLAVEQYKVERREYTPAKFHLLKEKILSLERRASSGSKKFGTKSSLRSNSITWDLPSPAWSLQGSSVSCESGFEDGQTIAVDQNHTSISAWITKCEDSVKNHIYSAEDSNMSTITVTVDKPNGSKCAKKDDKSAKTMMAPQNDVDWSIPPGSLALMNTVESPEIPKNEPQVHNDISGMHDSTNSKENLVKVLDMAFKDNVKTPNAEVSSTPVMETEGISRRKSLRSHSQSEGERPAPEVPPKMNNSTTEKSKTQSSLILPTMAVKPKAPTNTRKSLFSPNLQPLGFLKVEAVDVEPTILKIEDPNQEIDLHVFSISGTAANDSDDDIPLSTLLNTLPPNNDKSKRRTRSSTKSTPVKSTKIACSSTKFKSPIEKNDEKSSLNKEILAADIKSLFMASEESVVHNLITDLFGIESPIKNKPVENLVSVDHIISNQLNVDSLDENSTMEQGEDDVINENMLKHIFRSMDMPNVISPVDSPKRKFATRIKHNVVSIEKAVENESANDNIFRVENSSHPPTDNLHEDEVEIECSGSQMSQLQPDPPPQPKIDSPNATKLASPRKLARNAAMTLSILGDVANRCASDSSSVATKEDIQDIKKAIQILKDKVTCLAKYKTRRVRHFRRSKLKKSLSLKYHDKLRAMYSTGTDGGRLSSYRHAAKTENIGIQRPKPYPFSNIVARSDYLGKGRVVITEYTSPQSKNPDCHENLSSNDDVVEGSTATDQVPTMNYKQLTSDSSIQRTCVVPFNTHTDTSMGHNDSDIGHLDYGINDSSNNEPLQEGMSICDRKPVNNHKTLESDSVSNYECVDQLHKEDKSHDTRSLISGEKSSEETVPKAEDGAQTLEQSHSNTIRAAEDKTQMCSAGKTTTRGVRRKSAQVNVQKTATEQMKTNLKFVDIFGDDVSDPEDDLPLASKDTSGYRADTLRRSTRSLVSSTRAIDHSFPNKRKCTREAKTGREIECEETNSNSRRRIYSNSATIDESNVKSCRETQPRRSERRSNFSMSNNFELSTPSDVMSIQSSADRSLNDSSVECDAKGSVTDLEGIKRTAENEGGPNHQPKKSQRRRNRKRKQPEHCDENNRVPTADKKVRTNILEENNIVPFTAFEQEAIKKTTRSTESQTQLERSNQIIKKETPVLKTEPLSSTNSPLTSGDGSSSEIVSCESEGSNMIGNETKEDASENSGIRCDDAKSITHLLCTSNFDALRHGRAKNSNSVNNTATKEGCEVEKEEIKGLSVLRQSCLSYPLKECETKSEISAGSFSIYGSILELSSHTIPRAESTVFNECLDSDGIDCTTSVPLGSITYSEPYKECETVTGISASSFNFYGSNPEHSQQTNSGMSSEESTVLNDSDIVDYTMSVPVRSMSYSEPLEESETNPGIIAASFNFYGSISEHSTKSNSENQRRLENVTSVPPIVNKVTTSYIPKSPELETDSHRRRDLPNKNVLQTTTKQGTPIENADCNQNINRHKSRPDPYDVSNMWDRLKMMKMKKSSIAYPTTEPRLPAPLPEHSQTGVDCYQNVETPQGKDNFLGGLLSAMSKQEKEFTEPTSTFSIPRRKIAVPLPKKKKRKRKSKNKKKKEHVEKPIVTPPVEKDAETRVVLNAIESFLSSEHSNSDEIHESLNKCYSSLLQVPDKKVVSTIVRIVMENVNEEVDLRFTPPAPPLTRTQQKLISLFSAFPRFPRLYDDILIAIYEKIYPDRFIWPDDSVVTSTRFFTTLCRNSSKNWLAGRLMLDASTRMVQRGCLVIEAILDCWPELMPLASETSEYGLHATIAFLINHTPPSKLETQRKKAKFLMNRLKLYYGYRHDQTWDGFLKGALDGLKSGIKGQVECVVALGVRGEWDWAAEKIVRPLMEHIDSWRFGTIEDSKAESYLNVINRVMSTFPKDKPEAVAFVSEILSRVKEIALSDSVSKDGIENMRRLFVRCLKFMPPAMRSFVRRWKQYEKPAERKCEI